MAEPPPKKAKLCEEKEDESGCCHGPVSSKSWASSSEQQESLDVCDIRTKKLLENEGLLLTLRNEAYAYCAARGHVLATSAEVKGKDPPCCVFIHAPCTLIPTPIPEKSFKQIESIGTIFNQLVDAISRDVDFLTQSLASVAVVDSYIASLLNVLQTVHKEGVTQPISLGITRSDYMFAQIDGKLTPRQIELNTVAAGMGPLSSGINEMHKFLITRYLSNYYDAAKIPVNRGLTAIVEAMATAYKTHPAYGGPLAGHILMVVQSTEKNFIDQKNIEYLLWEKHRIPIVRATLTQISKNAHLCPETKDLLLCDKLMTVVYYRAGYTPKDYPTEKEWDAYLMIERSRAIKCPSIGYHLAGTKKIQQVLAMPGTLERFLSEEDAQKLRVTFASMWGLETETKEVKEAIAAAIKNPSKYVLKPQREGGGNNVWDQDIIKILSNGDLKERAKYILMERIQAVSHHTCTMKNGHHRLEECVTEYGVFYYYLGDGKREYHNTVGGHLLRTKGKTTHEGGVSSGYAFLDTPIYVDE